MLRGNDPAARQRVGVAYALAAFVFWGLAPVYFKAIAHVPPLEILAHRIVWSVPVTALLIAAARDWRRLGAALTSRKVVTTLAVSATLVGCNWLVFIHAVSSGQILQASLGYFINPLVNVLLGVVILGERLRRWQGLAVLLAALGTAALTASHGSLPWISLVLAFSFGFYGLLRKTVNIEAVNGLFVETVLLLPLAAGYLVVLTGSGRGSFASAGGDTSTTVLLSLAGLVTALPLVWFTSGARRLRYTTIGLTQYIAPTLHLALAVLLYGEPFTAAHLISFALIWMGLGIFATDSFRAQRARTAEEAATS